MRLDIGIIIFLLVGTMNFTEGIFIGRNARKSTFFYEIFDFLLKLTLEVPFVKENFDYFFGNIPNLNWECSQKGAPYL